MDVFLMIRRKKSTIFTDAKETTTVYELKKIVEGITKRPPEDQRLHKDELILEDTKTLGDCGFTSSTARAQAPATVGLAFKEGIISKTDYDQMPLLGVASAVAICTTLSTGEEDFEPLEVTPYSNPPELPDVMKPQESSTSNAAEQPVS